MLWRIVGTAVLGQFGFGGDLLGNAITYALDSVDEAAEASESPLPLQVYSETKDLPQEFLEDAWSHDYMVSDMFRTNAGWFIHAWHTPNRGQVVLGGAEFPAGELQRLWRTHEIYGISGSQIDWAIIMQERDEDESQEITLHESLPVSEIETAWKLGRRVAELAQGPKGQWVLVTDANQANQSMAFAVDPTKAVVDARREGRWLGNVVYTASQWLLIFEAHEGLSDQKWVLSSAFPEEFLSRHLESGYLMTQLAYGNGHWLAVTSQYPHLVP